MATKARTTRTTATTSKRAAIYCRISDARDGDTAGVDRQEADCRDLATSLGWTVSRVFIDNNVSAFAKRRPEYEAMLAAVDRGDIDAILVYATDRLYRALTDLQALVSRLGDLPVATCKSGDVDLTTADGRLHANLLGSVAQHESEKRGERVRRAAEDRARAGRFGGGGRRFGYNADATELVASEADLVREASEAIASGASVYSIVQKWKALGLVGTRGGQMNGPEVRAILMRPINAGHASYHGELIPDVSESPRIVSSELWEQVRAILSDPGRRTNVGRPVVSLLSGLAVCGVCGGPVRGAQKQNGSPTYRCHQNQCVVRRRPGLDDYVSSEIVAMLDANRDTLLAALSEAPTTGTPSGAVAEAAQLRQRLDALSDLLTAGDLDPGDFATATRKVRARLAAIEADIAASITSDSAVAGLLAADDIRQAWDAATVETQREVIREVLMPVAIPKAGHTGPVARFDDIELEWRNA